MKFLEEEQLEDWQIMKEFIRREMKLLGFSIEDLRKIKQYNLHNKSRKLCLNGLVLKKTD